MFTGVIAITNKGKALQAKVQAGATLNYTRIAIGDGSLSGQQTSDLNALINEKKTIAITRLKTQTGGVALVGGLLSNQSYSTGFYLREIGVFAQDPDVGEILYCYGNDGANAEYIPAGGGTTVVERNLDILTLTGNASNVSATIDSSLVFVKQSDFDAKLNGSSGHKHSGIAGDGSRIPASNISLLDSADYFIGTDPEAALAEVGLKLIASPAPTAVSLVNGAQVVQSTRVAPYNVLSIKGRTLVNKAGRSSFEGTNDGWSAYQGTLANAVNNCTTGQYRGEFTSNNAAGGNLNKYGLTFEAGKYYITIADIKNNTTAAGARIAIANGGPTINSPYVTDTNAFHTVYAKTATVATNSNVGIEIQTNGAVGTKFFVDSIRCYEVTAAEYAAIDGMTEAQINAKYPYVDDVKPITNPYAIKYGENLLPPFYEWSPSVNTSAVYNITGPYSATLVNTASGENAFWEAFAPVVPGQTYTPSATLSDGLIYYYYCDANKTRLLPATQYVGTTIAPANAAFLEFVYKPISSLADPNTQIVGTHTITNPMLNIGATALQFKQREDDYLIFPAKLHSNIDGSIYDEITYRDGQYWKNSRFKSVDLDGSLAWAWGNDKAGFKEVFVPSFLTNAVKTVNSGAAIKFDGKILSNIAAGIGTSAGDQFVLNTDNALVLTIADNDSGWGEGYTPSTAEIQACIYGWKMCDGVLATNPYNGSGNKFWVRRVELDQTTAANVCPTAPAGGKWTNYKLNYQLAAATTEVIPAEGGIMLHEGGNQFEVGAGMIVQEKVSLTADTNYQINIKGHPTVPNSNLAMRLGSLLDIYKNEKSDKASWTSVKDAYSYGNWRYRSANADPATAYTVTYLALDQYLLTGPVQTIDGEYSTNLKTAVDKLTQEQTNVLTRVSVLETQKAGRIQPQWIAATLLNGWLNFGGGFNDPQYMKDSVGVVHFRGRARSGTTGNDVLIFKLPPGYRPANNNLTYSYSNSDGTQKGEIVVKPWGDVTVWTTTNADLKLDGITFLAEQ